MGWHTCRHPCWHRALILCGTLIAFHVLGSLTPWTLWGIAGWVGGAWLLKHLLQWRCQGHEPSDGRKTAALLLMMGSAAYLTHNNND